MGVSGSDAQNVYDFSAKDINGKEVSLAEFKGHVLLIVNVASKCGLTASNYEQLSKIDDMFHAKGLRVLLFPCNQFGGQEPGTNEQVCEYISGFKKKFQIFEKIAVNGNEAHPLYKFLKNKCSGFLVDAIKWNFTKFLVDANGVPVKRYAPTDDPLKIVPDIEALLNKK